MATIPGASTDHADRVEAVPLVLEGKDVIETSELYRALVDAQSALGVGLAVVDLRTGRHVFVNDALAAMYGYTPEEMLAMPGLLVPVTGDIVEGRRKDGTPIRVEASLEPMEGDRAVVLVRDITEQELVARRYRTLVERVPAVVYEAEPGAHGRWRYVSPYIETMLGFPPGDWLADAALWAARLHPDDREMVLEQEQRLDDGERVSMEYRMVARDGSIVWVHDEAS